MLLNLRLSSAVALLLIASCFNTQINAAPASGQLPASNQQVTTDEDNARSAALSKLAESLPVIPTAHINKPDIPAVATQNLYADLSHAHVRAVMKAVADWQITNKPEATTVARLTGKTDPRQWSYATFFTGLMAWAEHSHDSHYWDYLHHQGQLNQWQMAEDIYHADAQLIGSLYIGLAEHYRKADYYSRLQQNFDSILATPATNSTFIHPEPSLKMMLHGDDALKRWIWADALFMAPATWMQLSTITGDSRYRDFAIAEFWATHQHLYDGAESLYFRDSRFIEQRSSQGQKIFWSRGNGWVFAGIARILEQLPTTDPRRAEFIRIFKSMAKRLAGLQTDSGYWPADLLNQHELQIPETSGTALNTFALAWGINAGILDQENYQALVRRGWRALAEAVNTEGKLGWVQGMGDSPAKSSYYESSLYASGALLLAGSEILKLPTTDRPCREKELKVTISNPSKDLPLQDYTVELRAENNRKIHKLLSCVNKVITVKDVANDHYLPNQTIDLDNNGQPEALLFQVNLASGESRSYILDTADSNPIPDIGGISYSRIVPERQDDFAWENNRIATRLYGPTLQQTGEIVSGFDVWGKRVGRNVINGWYKGPFTRTNNYHIDTGEGADFYKVGNTLGLGGHAVLINEKLYLPETFTRARVLTTGPIRTVFELDYDQWPTPLGNLTITRRISLDRDHNLFRVEMHWQNTGTQHEQSNIPLVIGLSNKNGKTLELQWRSDSGILSQWSNLGDMWKHLGTALVVPRQGKTAMQQAHEAHHYLLLTSHPRAESFLYYAGFCWEKSLQCDNAKQWKKYLLTYASNLKLKPIIKIRHN